MKLLLVSAAALIRPDGCVLLAQRPRGDLAGLWEFPGGKLEPAEAPEACLIRELREELSIEVDAAALEPLTFASHAINADRHLLMPLYAIRDWQGEPVGAEGQSLEWVASGDLEGFAMPEADVPLIPHVRRAMSRVS